MTHKRYDYIESTIKMINFTMPPSSIDWQRVGKEFLEKVRKVVLSL